MFKFKRYIAFALVVILIFSCTIAHGEGESLELKCPSALLMDFSTGTILYEKDSHVKLPMASVTKIMTMLLAMEAIDAGKIGYDDMITGSENAKSMGGSTIFLDAGEQLSVRDILKGIAVASGNDAAVAMAEHIAGSEEGFVSMMNERAKELGMNDTNFENPNGLDSDNHYSCAYDIALMSRELMKHEDIFEFTGIWMDSLRDGKFTLSNTNKLIRFFKGATGLKTGSTDRAKFCISATAKRDDLHLIAVIMAAPTSKERSADASKLLNYGFANYGIKQIAKKGEVVGSVRVDKAEDREFNVVCKDNVEILYKKSQPPETKREVVYDKELIAPIGEGQRAGELIVYNNDEKLSTCEIVFDENIYKLNVVKSFALLWDKWVNA